MADRHLSVLSLAWRETEMQLRLLRRNPLSVLFTIALPLLLLPLLEALNGDLRVRLPAAPPGAESGGVDGLGRALWMQYATPAIAAFAVVAACFANLAIRTSVAREQGVLKRVRGTPLPPSAHLAGRVFANALVAVLVAAFTLAAGMAIYDVRVAAADVPVFVALVVLGAAAFSALGLAATGIVPNSDAAPAIVYALLFPLAFLSNVFYPPELAPDWMQRTAEALPLGPFVSAAVGSTTPTATGSGVLFAEFSAITAWGVFGAVVALVTFKWAPNRERTPPSRAHSMTAPRRLAIPLALLLLTVGVVVPDHDRPPTTVTAGTIEELEESGTLTVSVYLDPDHLEVIDDAGTGGVAVGLGSSTQGSPREILLGTFFSDGATEGGYTAAPSSIEVTVVDLEEGPAAYGFPGCGVLPVSRVDAEWLGLVAPDRRGGALVQPCNGAVYEKDGRCAAGPCFGPVILPTSVVDGRVEVTSRGTIDLSLATTRTPLSSFDDVRVTYRGTASIGSGDEQKVITSDFVLTAGDDGLLFEGGQFGLTRLRLESFSPAAATISGIEIIGPPDGSDPVGSIFAPGLLPFSSLETGADAVVADLGTSFHASRPEDGRRVIEWQPDGSDEFVTLEGRFVFVTTGPLLDWTSVNATFEQGGQPIAVFDLERVA